MLNFTDFLWSYKISVSVQIYRDCNLQRKCGHLTEILPTFLKSVNGSSFPVITLARCVILQEHSCIIPILHYFACKFTILLRVKLHLRKLV